MSIKEIFTTGVEIFIDRPGMSGITVKNVEIRKDDERVRIGMEVSRSGRVRDSWNSNVTLYTRTRKIDWGRSSDFIFGKEHVGSAGIAIAIYTLLSIPLIFLTALITIPYIISQQRKYHGEVERQGISHHGLELLKKLKGHLDSETEKLLIDALKNDYAWEKKYRRYVSMKEAQEVLSSCDSEELIAFFPEGDQFEQHKKYQWVDEDSEKVAWGDLYVPKLSGIHGQYIHVLGSHFMDDEVEQLVGRYRTRETHTHHYGKY